MSRSGSDVRESEQTCRFVQDRITAVEKHFGIICDSFGAYARKSARLRDKGDGISRSLMEYAEHENLNHTYKNSIIKFAESLSAIEDYRQAEVQRLDAKIIQPLSQYGANCKQAKESITKAFQAHDREEKRKKTLHSTRDKNPSDRGKITKAAKDVEEAGLEAAKITKQLEDQVDTFERKKLRDVRTLLLDFVNIEMIFHAKALENLTQCFKSLSIMSEEEDLEEFRNSLHFNSHPSERLKMHRSSSRTSLNSAGKSTGKSTGKSLHTPPTTPRKSKSKPTPTSSSRKPVVTNHNHSTHNGRLPDDDDDDEDDEEDDSEVSEDYNYRN